VPGYPENTTALVGGQAKLACQVHRPASTKVQWLKTEVSQGGPPRLRALTVRTDTDTNHFTVGFSPVVIVDVRLHPSILERDPPLFSPEGFFPFFPPEGLFGSFSSSDARFWGRDVYVYRL